MFLINSLNLSPSFPFQPQPDYLMALSSFLFIFAGILFGILIPVFILKRAKTYIDENPGKIQDLLNKKRLFIESVTSNEARKLLNQSELLDNSMTCFQCGGKIFPHEKYCSNCGDSTRDEFNPIKY